jgi:Reverse transcriptase (RNA-dependent DNA polymerase)
MITKEQLTRIVNKTSPNKAPGPDEIPNLIIQQSYLLIWQHLLDLINISIKLSHYPNPFKHSTTVVLRKPGKPSYKVPKAYRPITLEVTLGKIMETCIAEILSYLIEEHQLIAGTHMGGGKQKSTQDAILYLIEKIYESWQKGEVFSALMLDVTGAFVNVHHQRLIHNLKKRSVPS